MKKTVILWEKIFNVKQFDTSKDVHLITADEISDISGEEARIMARFDSASDLPRVFRQYGYFLLPVKNGTYAIVRGEGFHTLERQHSVERYDSRIAFHLTTAGRGYSEMQYLDYSYNSGALEHVLNQGSLYQSIRGREYSKKFWFYVNRTKVDVSSVQLEVDSGLEGEDSIVLVEAKMGMPEDFIIRQLFYPYKHFKIISPEKRIIPVFFTYEITTKRFNFWLYEFTNPEQYNSISLQSMRSLEISAKRSLDLATIKPSGTRLSSHRVPQANDLNKVIELVFKVHEGLHTGSQIAGYFQFEQRQANYYQDAAEALGLVSKQRGRFELTDIGQHFVGLPAEKRNLFMMQLLNDFELVKNSIDVLKKTGTLTNADIKNVIARGSSLGSKTIARRAASLRAWLKWISEATGAYVYDGNNFQSLK